MANIFSLFGEVFIDNKKANKSIDDMTGKAKDSSSKVGSAFSSIAKGAAAVGTAVVAGASAAGGAAYKLAQDTAANADEVDKMSQKLGMSRKAYQEWDYVLSQAGVEITSMSTGLKTLTNKIDDAKNGSSSAMAMFDKLGISMSDLNKMSREEIFDTVIKGMQGMEDSTERAALANDLFGKSGQELTALFNESAQSTENLKNKARELGMVMSDETVDSGVKFTDTMDTIKRSVGGLMNSLGGAVLPIILNVLGLVEGKMPGIQNLIVKMQPVIQALFNGILPPLLDLTSEILPLAIDLIVQILPFLSSIISSILPAIIQLLQILLPPAMQIIEAILPLLLKLIEPLFPLLSPILSLLQPFIDLLMLIILPLTELIDVVLPPLIQLFSDLLQWVLPKLQSAFSFVANEIGGRFKNTMSDITRYVGNLKNIFFGIIDFVKNVFTGNWKGAWQSVVQIFSNVFQGIKNAFKIPINWIIDGMNSFIRQMNKVKVPDWVPGVGGKGISIKELKRLRIGMDYVPYDEFPALLHKGERVLTASENKEYSANNQNRSGISDGKQIVFKIEIGEKAIYVENLNGKDENDINSFVDMILDLIFEKIKRKGAVFA